MPHQFVVGSKRLLQETVCSGLSLLVCGVVMQRQVRVQPHRRPRSRCSEDCHDVRHGGNAASVSLRARACRCCAGFARGAAAEVGLLEKSFLRASTRGVLLSVGRARRCASPGADGARELL